MIDRQILDHRVGPRAAETEVLCFAARRVGVTGNLDGVSFGSCGFRGEVIELLLCFRRKHGAVHSESNSDSFLHVDFVERIDAFVGVGCFIPGLGGNRV